MNQNLIGSLQIFLDDRPEYMRKWSARIQKLAEGLRRPGCRRGLLDACDPKWIKLGGWEVRE
jgi:hypothetical protein